MAKTDASMTDEERRGYRYGKSGSHTVLEEYDVEAEGWYTMATLHEPDENRTGERLVAALVVFDTNAKLVEVRDVSPKCVAQSCPNSGPFTKMGHCNFHRFLG